VDVIAIRSWPPVLTAHPVLLTGVGEPWGQSGIKKHGVKHRTNKHMSYANNPAELQYKTDALNLLVRYWVKHGISEVASLSLCRYQGFPTWIHVHSVYMQWYFFPQMPT
jgi:hypothetical protein